LRIMSRSPATTRTGRRSAAAGSGLPGPNGFTAGWSMVAPAGSYSRQNRSNRSRFRSTSSVGHSASDRVRRTPPKNGIRRT